MTHTTYSFVNLQRALAVAERIATLEAELAAILGGIAPATPAKSALAPLVRSKPGKTGKRTMSAAGRARIIAAQKARWARIRKEKAPAALAKSGVKAGAKAKARKGGLTPAGRARLSAKMKARWAARKKGAPALNAPAKSRKKVK